MPIPPFLQKWLFLNLLRLLTLTSCLLVFVSTILILRTNFRHLPSSTSSLPLTPSSNTTSTSDLDYYPSTDIPTQTWGVLWSTLHHIYNLLCLFLVILSEVSWGGWLDRFFASTLPFLGPEWGTEMMGALLILIGADSLSRRLDRLALVVNWILVCVGLANLISGLSFHSRGKLLRSPLGFKAPVADKLEKLAEARSKAEKVKDLLLPLPVVSAPSNASSETVVAPSSMGDKLRGFWKSPSAAAEFKESSIAPAGVPVQALPPSVPFQPGVPAPPPPILPPPTATIHPAPPPKTPTHRTRSTDFTIVNAPSSPQFLTPPSPSTTSLSERSPGVLAKFRAAELEAKLKAKRRAEKKSLYLGSQRWLESRQGRLPGYFTPPGSTRRRSASLSGYREGDREGEGEGRGGKNEEDTKGGRECRRKAPTHSHNEHEDEEEETGIVSDSELAQVGRPNRLSKRFVRARSRAKERAYGFV
ncbi:hypothetical protein ACQY0O_008187 [Thecaphora frezii]